MWIFCFLFWTAVRASEESLYKKIGDNVVLTPDSVENPITNIRWKRGPDIAMEWNGDKTISYKQFKDRGSLNISTGVMTITGLTRDDSGIYTAEINGKETNSQTELLVISPVPKPTIYKSCDTGMTSCVLTCDGSTTDAEPVTYWWTADEKKWSSTKEHKITKEDKEWWFSCTLENPVSTNSSEKVFTLLMIISDQTWIYILIPVILVVCIFIIIYLIHKYRKEIEVMLSGVKNTSNQDPTSVDVPDTSSGSEIEVMLSGVKNTSNQDPTSVDVPDTSSGSVEKPGSPPLMKEASTQNTSTAPPKTSNETVFKPLWQYERESGGWWDFRETTDPLNERSVTSDDIEKWYHENPKIKMSFKVNEDEYELDFTVFTEQSHADPTTSNVRKVRRVTVDHECYYIAVPTTK